MTDLYFRYHWACVEKRLKPETQTGNLNPDVVIYAGDIFDNDYDNT